MVPEFIYQISLLNNPGVYSKPFLTSYGWHIVKLVNRERPGSFEDEKEELNKRLTRDSRAHKSEEAVINKVKKDFKFKEYQKNITEVLQLIDSAIFTATWSPEAAENMLKPVFKLGKQKYTQKDLALFIEGQQKKEKATAIGPFFNNAYQQFVNQSCVNYLDKRLEEIYPEFGLLMKEYRDGILLFELTDNKVWSKAVNDTLGLETFYSENQNKYTWQDRVLVTVLTFQDFSDVKTLNSLFATGKKFNIIISDTTVFVPENIVVKEKKYQKGENNTIDAMPWKVGQFKVEPQGNDAVVYIIDELLEPVAKTLDESRGLVIADYQNKLEKEWIQGLRQKYPVIVNEKVLASIKEGY